VAEGDGEGQTTGAHSATPDVFISYASQDASIADSVVAALERQGLTCWIAPRNVTPGAFYGDEIVHAIDAAKAIVLILSQNAADSQHVLREVERAASKRHTVVSLRVDQAPLPAGLEYFLNTSQWLDASGGNIAHSIPKLIAAVRVAIQAPVVTPETTRTPRGPAPSPSARSSKRTGIIVASLIGLAIAGYAVDRLWVSSRRAAPTSVPTVAVPAPAPAPAAPAISEKSVAVLPFVDMSEKKDQEYFSDGLTEELIDMLTKVPDLRVPARTSSFYFKGKQTKIADIGKELSVAHILEGSVRKSGKTLRITAQLIRVDNGYHVWSQTYDRTLNDIFKVQDEIAGSVVTALKLSLLAASMPKASSAENTEAYTLYLKARALVVQGAKQATEQASVYLRQALELDPKFAPAWALYAKTRTMMYESGNINFQQARDEARDAATRAIALGPDLCAAHVSMARVHYFFDWNWDAVDAEITLARQLDPNDSDALRYAGNIALIRGRWDEAIDVLLRAVERDPLEAANYQILGAAYLAAGRLEESRLAFQHSAALNPSLGGHWGRAVVLLIGGEPAAALTESELSPDEDDRLVGRALALYALGQHAAANAALADLEKRFADNDEFSIGMIHAYRGDIDKSFTWLERAYARKDHSLIWIKGLPLAQNLKGDPRYDAMLRKMKLLD
jgi:TolB-like protein/tetratricopeptide (TPR) repeat protein